MTNDIDCFQPETAIEVQRRFSRDVAGRATPVRRQAIVQIVPHSAILETETADRLVASALAAQGRGHGPGLISREVCVEHQFALAVALPHKSGNEQLEIIAALPGRFLFLSMLRQVNPAEESILKAVWSAQSSLATPMPSSASWRSFNTAARLFPSVSSIEYHPKSHR